MTDHTDEEQMDFEKTAEIMGSHVEVEEAFDMDGNKVSEDRLKEINRLSKQNQAKFQHDKKNSKYKSTHGTVRVNKDGTGYEINPMKGGLNRHERRKLAKINNKKSNRSK